MPGLPPEGADTDADAEALQESALTRSVLRAAAANPQYLPELLASYAVRHMGPAAARSVARTRAAQPDATMAELRAAVLDRGKRRVVSQGAFVGGPMMIMAPFAFCAALLSQARTCLELAALEGQDPSSPVRSAELLVLQGVYPDVDRARAALSAASLAEQEKAKERQAGKAAARKGVTGRGAARRDRVGAARSVRDRRRVTVLWELTMRMARVLGLIAPQDEVTTRGPARWPAAVAHYTVLGVVFLIAMVAPLVWVPYLGRSYSRSTDRFLDRATAFYSGGPVARPPRTTRVGPGMPAATVRALLSLLIPVGVIVAVVLADLRLADSLWPVLAATLITASFGMAVAWQWRRRHKRRTG
ncbi:hypothetical protein [Streptomyces chromofuscus]|uniref:Uncharacterized protein n=1 Tax=Streptomyces chromofuscus TaxID=42881 RepID=A0A7M2T138_STRCW|nr:hypothetical protein [Streptomyces chromofuscus]QOV42370.1 hypothetical protein IPT68_21295 [Streptomyces chromofuscus]GGT27627.1 hypothetical protein GCM10010254_55410 [Streptomyces chromofuscus]